MFWHTLSYRAMKKLLTPILFIFISQIAFSQSDLLVLKQRNQIIQTWVPGSFIDFQFSSKQWIQGIIKTVRNDSILMEIIILHQVPTQLGFLKIDTARMGPLKLHVKEIYGMPKRQFSSGIISNGALFQLGSGAYIFLNVFNSLIHKEPVFSAKNSTGLGIAAGIFVLGKILASTHKTYITLGGKYKMETIHI